MSVKRSFRRALTAAVVLTLATGAWAQSKTTSALTGTVKGEDGGVVVGASVTIESPSLIGGSRSQVTDSQGKYRFGEIAPGDYTVIVVMPGFKTVKRPDVRLSVGATIDIPFKLTAFGGEETVTVTAEAPAIDVTSTEKTTILTNDYLQNLPNSQFQPDTLNLAPGINLDSAYGGGGSAANAWQLDGVDTSDPEAGSAWSFVNYNIIDEVQLVGLGAPAEYGGFTGVAFNSTTKSGGNDVHGLVDAYFSNDSLTWNNSAPAGANPTLNKYLNTTVNVGGPFVKDKLWWYISGQYFNTVTNNGGPDRSETSPRLFGKISWQVNPNNTFDAWIEWDKYQIKGRGGDTITPLEATVREDAPEYVWNFSWKTVFSKDTVLNVALTGYTGYYYLDPENGYNVQGLYNDVIDPGTGEPTGTFSQNSTYYFLADRDRNQLNASISHHVSDFAGNHDFKFGVEIERSTLRNRYGYPTGSWEYRNYYGYNYNIDAYDTGTINYAGSSYDVHATNQRYAFFAQDDWQITPRFTLNPGVRFDYIEGKVPQLGKVYDYLAIAPRLGFAWNVTGDGKNLIKAHYGRYFPGAKGTYYYWVDPGAFEPSITTTTWDSGGVDVATQSTSYAIDPNLKHPYMDQYILGYDRDLGHGLTLSITGVYRKWKRFVETVAQNPDYTPVTGEVGVIQDVCTGPIDPDTGQPTCLTVSTGQTVTMYDWNNFATDTLLVTNPDGLERTYKGGLLTLTKNFRNNWQLLASYVYSETRGTIDNVDFDASSDSTGQEGGPSPFLDTPNSKINWNGRLTYDLPHQVKLQGTYVFSGANLWLSANYTFYSGTTYTKKSQCLLVDEDNNPTTDPTCHAFPQSDIAKVRFLAEPRGDRRLESFNELNTRLEWKPAVGKNGAIGVSLEVFNLLNNSQITEVQDRDNGSFGEPLSFNIGRNVRFGVRYSF